MKKYIVLSVNQNVDYMYFMPITVWSWHIIGFEPIIFYRGDRNEISDLVFKSTDKICYNERILRMLKPIDGIRDATVTQVSRLYAACLGIEDDAYIMLGDCDMLALGNHWNPDVSKVTVYNHDLTGFSEIPMCYVGAPKTTWLEIMGLYSMDYNDAIKRDIENYPNAKDDDFYKWWGCDQQILTERLNQYGKEKITFINRGQGSHGYARGRVDRGSGGWVLNQPELIDAHLEQQTWQNEAKTQRLYELLAHVWPNENFDWFKNYTNEFRKLAV